VNADMNVSVVDMTIVTGSQIWHNICIIGITSAVYRLGNPVVQLGWRFF